MECKSKKVGMRVISFLLVIGLASSSAELLVFGDIGAEKQEFPPIKALFDHYHYTTADAWGKWFEDNYPGELTASYLTGPLTYEGLKDYDIFITYLSWKPDLGPLPTASEVEALEHYVRNGGGVLLMGDDLYGGGWTNEHCNILSEPYNVFFNEDQLLDPTDYDITVTRPEDDYERHIVFHNITEHPVTAGVNRVWVHGTCSLVVNNPNAVIVVAGDDDTYSDRYPGYPMGSYPPAIVALEHGSGRILFAGDCSGFKHNVYDNKTFMWNILRWLAETPMPKQLAEKYKPYLYTFRLLNYEDIFRPVLVNAIVDDQYHWTLYETGGLGNINPLDDNREVLTNNFTLNDLYDYQSENYYVSLFPLRDYIFDIYPLPIPGYPACVPIVPPEILVKLIFLNEKYKGEQPKVYVRFSSDIYGEEEYFVIQYWFFYVFNDFTNPHEGDWEMVELVFKKEDIDNKGIEAQPIYVAATQHDGGELRRYDSLAEGDDLPCVSRIGGHPIIYVARGSHANYFEEGVYELLLGPFVQWLGPAILHMKYVLGITIPTSISLLFGFFQVIDYVFLCDYTDSHGEPYAPQLTFIDENTDKWLDFGGRWGFVNGDPLYNGIFDGPKGPTHQGKKWNSSAQWAFTVTSRAHKKLLASYIFHLLSPADMLISNQEGQQLGFANGQLVCEIPHSLINCLSEEEIYIVPADGDYDILISGTATGDFSFVTRTEIPGSMSMLFGFIDIPADENMKAYVRVGEGLKDKIMRIDNDGDGIIDQTMRPTVGVSAYLNCTGFCLTSQPGKEILIELIVKNEGSDFDTFDLSANIPTGWNYEFSEDIVSLNGGENHTLALKLNVPSDSELGKYPIRLNVESQSIAGLSVQIEPIITLERPQGAVKEKVIQNLMQPLASYRISQAESLEEKAHLLLQEAIDKGLDISEALPLVEKADEFSADAKKLYLSGNYIAANNIALQAIDLYKQAIDILEEILGS